MTEAMPFLQKAILLSYDPRPFSGGPYNTITLEENGEDISVALETIKDSEWQAGVRFFTTAFHNHEFLR